MKLHRGVAGVLFLVVEPQSGCLLLPIPANGLGAILEITTTAHCEGPLGMGGDLLCALLHGNLEMLGREETCVETCVSGLTLVAMLHRPRWNLVECPQTHLSHTNIPPIAGMCHYLTHARVQTVVIMDLPDYRPKR